MPMYVPGSLPGTRRMPPISRSAAGDSGTRTTSACAIRCFLCVQAYKKGSWLLRKICSSSGSCNHIGFIFGSVQKLFLICMLKKVEYSESSAFQWVGRVVSEVFSWTVKNTFLVFSIPSRFLLVSFHQYVILALLELRKKRQLGVGKWSKIAM